MILLIHKEKLSVLFTITECRETFLSLINPLIQLALITYLLGPDTVGRHGRLRKKSKIQPRGRVLTEGSYG